MKSVDPFQYFLQALIAEGIPLATCAGCGNQRMQELLVEDRKGYCPRCVVARQKAAEYRRTPLSSHSTGTVSRAAVRKAVRG